MDVSGWTVDQRMRLPDWVFGNRTLIGVYVANAGTGTYAWGISDIQLPDPVCIWKFFYICQEQTGQSGNYRAGLAEEVPTSSAEMDEATEFYPHYGVPRTGPNLLPRAAYQPTTIEIPMRKGMVTGSKYLVVENYTVNSQSRVYVNILVSGLPTSMAGWLAHSKV